MESQNMKERIKEIRDEVKVIDKEMQKMKTDIDASIQKHNVAIGLKLKAKERLAGKIDMLEEFIRLEE